MMHVQGFLHNPLRSRVSCSLLLTLILKHIHNKTKDHLKASKMLEIILTFPGLDARKLYQYLQLNFCAR